MHPWLHDNSTRKTPCRLNGNPISRILKDNVLGNDG
jgi:hypothetical protein